VRAWQRSNNTLENNTTIQHTATRVFQRDVACCSVLQCVAVFFVVFQSVIAEKQYNTLHNTLQHTATHYNTLQRAATHIYEPWTAAQQQDTALESLIYAYTHMNLLQHTATHCNTLQHTATHCNTLQHAATHAYEPWAAEQQE